QDFIRCGVPSLDSIVTAVHDRKVLQPETKVETQSATNLPIIANIVALLRLACPHRIVELICLSHGTRKPQQERGVSIEVVRRGSAVQRRRPGYEIEPSAWTPAPYLRLPVIHLVTKQVHTKPDAVGTLAHIHVGGISVQLVVAHDRAPIVL